MKKLMFLTMIFGLMVVFTGSISAQDCVGKRPKVGDKFIVTPNGETSLYSRNTDPYGPWYLVCRLTIDLSEYKKQRAPKEAYYTTIHWVDPQYQVLPKGYIVKRMVKKDADTYRFMSADKKTEVGAAIAMLDKPDPKW